MTDIFLSYASQDRDRTRLFAKALEAEGFTVWWDNAIRSGDSFDEAIEKALRAAKAVIVLWSTTSVSSRWVRAEATQADRLGTLVPVMIEPCERPIMFELKHTVDLTHWNGSSKDPAWQDLLEDVRKLTGSERSAPPNPSPLKTRGRRKPAMALLVGIAVLAVAVLAAGAFFFLRPQSPQTDRVAFFGFTADSADPVALAMAKSATDEAFQGMSAMRLDTAARAETIRPGITDRLAVARQLKSPYALSGEVRPEGGRISISVRLEAVANRATLVEESVSGGAAEARALPFQAAARATSLVQCVTRLRSGARNGGPEIITLIAQICAGGGLDTVRPEQIAPARDLARREPKSAVIQDNLARVLIFNQQGAPAAEREGRIAEAAAAVDRAASLSKTPGALISRPLVLYAQGGPLAPVDSAFQEGLKVMQTDGRNMGAYRVFLTAVGRHQDALPYGRAGALERRLSAPFLAGLAQTLAATGRPEEARRLFQQTNATLPGAIAWEMWAMEAGFGGLGDADEALAAAPPSVQGDTVACLRDLLAAAASTEGAIRRQGSARARQCLASGSLLPESALLILLALDDRDAAIAMAGSLDRNVPLSMMRATRQLFTPAAAPLRGDPRFLRLVEKLGLMDYWRTTKTRPDVCATETAPFCAALK